MKSQFRYIYGQVIFPLMLKLLLHRGRPDPQVTEGASQDNVWKLRAPGP